MLTPGADLKLFTHAAPVAPNSGFDVPLNGFAPCCMDWRKRSRDSASRSATMLSSFMEQPLRAASQCLP